MNYIEHKMSNPESKPIIVLDFGAPYSKLIAQARFLLIALLVFTSLSCSKGILYRIRDARVVNSEGYAIQFEIRNRESLIISTEGFELEIPRQVFLYSPPKYSGGRFWPRIHVANTSNQTQEISLRSLRITPLRWVARDDAGTPDPLALDSANLKILLLSSENDPTQKYVRVHTMKVEPGEVGQFSLAIDLPFLMIRGQVSAVFYDHRSASEIQVDYILYAKGKPGKEPLIVQAYEQSDVQP